LVSADLLDAGWTGGRWSAASLQPRRDRLARQNPSASVLLGSETEQALHESASPVLAVKPVAAHSPSVHTFLGDQALPGKL
jgi:hypothetical protein